MDNDSFHVVIDFLGLELLSNAHFYFKMFNTGIWLVDSIAASQAQTLLENHN